MRAAPALSREAVRARARSAAAPCPAEVPREVLDALLELYSTPSLATLPTAALQLLRRWIPSLFASYYEVEEGSAASAHVCEPEQYTTISARLLPLLSPRVDGAKHGGTAVNWEQRVREALKGPLRRSKNSKHEPEVEDVLPIVLEPSVDTTVIMALTRAGQMFTENEHALAASLRPHLLRAYEIVVSLGQRRDAAAAESDPAAASVLLRRSFGLTDRESELLYWLVRGKSNREMGVIFNISARTVDKHLQHVFDKMDVENRHAAVVQALQAISSKVTQLSTRNRV